MLFDLGNFIAAPSQELLDLAKKSSLLDISNHYGLPNVKRPSLWTMTFLIPRPHLKF